LFALFTLFAFYFLIDCYKNIALESLLVLIFLCNVNFQSLETSRCNHCYIYVNFNLILLGLTSTDLMTQFVKLT